MRERRTAALDDTHGQLGAGRVEREAQARGRRFALRGERPEDERYGTACLGSDGKALQLGIAHFRQPGRQCVAASRAQRLLGGPQGMAPARRLHDEKMHEVDARGRQRRRIRHMRCGDPDGTLASARQARQCREEKLQLADADRIGQQLAQPVPRPAAAWKLGIEDVMAAGDSVAGRRERGAAAPDGLPLQKVVQGAHTVFSYSISRRAMGRLKFPWRPP